MWVRQREFDRGVDPILFEAVRDWLEKEWPFEVIAFPGRESNP